MNTIYRFTRKTALAAAFAATLLSLGCSDRERSNPFDPANPDPGKSNVGFNALAGNGRVMLIWDPLDFVDLKGIKVLRLSGQEPDTLLLNDSLLPINATGMVDDSLENGVTYTYNLQFVLKDSPEMPKTRPEVVTPGTVAGWVAIREGTEVVKMTPDFRDEFFNLNVVFYDIVDIKVRPENREVWVLDGLFGELYRFMVTGEPREEASDLNQISAFCFDENYNSVWIAVQSSKGLIYHFGQGGNLIQAYSANLMPTSLAVDYVEGGVWAGSSEQMIARIQGNSNITVSHSDFRIPEKVVSGQYSSGAWVLDTGSKMLFRFRTAGRLVWKSMVFNKPVDVAVDNSGDLCWVADQGKNVVYEINSQGEVNVEISGLGEPANLAYSPSENALFVTGRSGLVSKVRPGGVIDWQIELTNGPGKLDLQLLP
ncbi:MAG: hypothetical protein U9N45_07045 [Gemmatimonadota bacterium]|nr:hypothetical protein [Gemmatimonadota bacterium]